MISINAAKIAYLVLGLLDLAVALLITMGIGFSSVSLAGKMALYVDLPLAIGVIAFFTKNRLLPLFMLAGSISTLTYISWFTYGSYKSGNPPLPFHIIWAALSLTLASLAIYVAMRPIAVQE